MSTKAKLHTKRVETGDAKWPWGGRLAAAVLQVAGGEDLRAQEPVFKSQHSQLLP